MIALSSAPQQCPELPTSCRQTQRYNAHRVNSLLFLLSLDTASHSPPDPMASPLISPPLKEKKGQPLSNTCLSFLSLFFISYCFWFFSLSVCVLYILTLYKPEGCRNRGGSGGWMLFEMGFQGLILLGNYA